MSVREPVLAVGGRALAGLLACSCDQTRRVCALLSPPPPPLLPNPALSRSAPTLPRPPRRVRHAAALRDVSKYFAVIGVGATLTVAIALATALRPKYVAFDASVSLGTDVALLFPDLDQLRAAGAQDAMRDAGSVVFVASCQEDYIEIRDSLGGEEIVVLDVNDFSCVESVAADKQRGHSAVAAVDNGIEWVLRSLTPNHREVLRAVLLLCKDSKVADYEEVRAECENQLLARTEQQFKEHLTELIDHGILHRDARKIVLLKDFAEIEGALNSIK